MATTYETNPTPRRAFAAIKTPLPAEPERPAGAPVSVADRLDRLTSRMLRIEAEIALATDLANACLAELDAIEGEPEV